MLQDNSKESDNETRGENPLASSGLTDWAKEPTLQDLKSDLEAAKPSHDAWVQQINRWAELLRPKKRAKANESGRKQGRSRSSVQPKIIRRQAEWRYSALTEPFLSSEKLFEVSPATFEDVEGAEQNELLLNHQFRTKLNRIKFIDDYVRSTVDEGTCIVRTGWKRVTKMVPTEVPVFGYYEIMDEESLARFQQAIELKNSDPRGFDEGATDEIKAAVEYYEENQQPVTAVIEGTQTVDVEHVIENRPDLKVFNPQNVVIDPSCEGDLDKALFAVFSFETSLSELKKEKRYKNLDKVVWDDASPITTSEHETNTPNDFQFKDKARKKVVAYEYWGFCDITGDGTLTPIVCTWIGDVVIRMEENPFPDGKLPLVVVPYMPMKRELTGEPDAELLEDNQAIIGAVVRGMIDLMGRSANGQQGFAKGMLDPLNRRRFEAGQDYEFNPNSNPQSSYIQHKYPELPQSAMAMIQLQNFEAEGLTGVKSFSGGMSGEAYGKVAAGIRGMLDAASKREMAILRRLAKGIVDIGRKIASMNAEFLSEEETIRVTNEKFVTVSRDALIGEFDFIVNISTAEIEDSQAERLAFLLQTMGNNIDINLSKLILTKIAKLNRMPDLAEAIQNYEPQPDPMQEEIQRLEIEKLKMEIAKLESETVRNQADAAEKTAEAEAIQNDTIEKVTGISHQRDVEKQGAQAKANQNLEITRALASEKDPGKQAPDISAAIGYNELTGGR